MTELQSYIAVVNQDEIAEGEIVRFEVDQEPRILTRVDGMLYAMDGICSHEYAELAEGEVDDNVVWCPLHGSGFRVGSGAATNLPAVVPVEVYDVKTIDNVVYVSVDPDDAA